MDLRLEVLTEVVMHLRLGVLVGLTGVLTVLTDLRLGLRSVVTLVMVRQHMALTAA
jgi:hypothetical protein